MKYKVIQPPQHLADYVRFFWFAEANASSHNPYIHHAFAYSCPEILFCYKGGFNYKFGLSEETNLISGIYGQTQTFSRVASNTDFGIFGFYLYPHALSQLFCLPASELTNQSIDMKTLCGKEGELLEEKIMLAPNNHQRVQIICDFLRARLKNVKTEYRTIFSSIKAIANSHQLTSVKALAENNFLSLRQFERRFKDFSGFTPKLFLRIVRFNSVIKRGFKNTSLTKIAYECGYYDQSHFIHDFQKFSGYSPKDYFKMETVGASDRGTLEFNS